MCAGFPVGSRRQTSGGGQDTIDEVAALAGESEAREQSSAGSHRLRQGLFRLLLARGDYKQMLAGGGVLARPGGSTHNSRMEAMDKAAQGVALIFLDRLSEGVPILEDAVSMLLSAGMRQEVSDVTMVLARA